MTNLVDRVHPSLRSKYASALRRGRETGGSITEERVRRQVLHLTREFDSSELDVEDGKLGEVPVRLYEPRASELAATVIWAHGGGWVLGDARGDDPLCARIAKWADVRVIAVDYRLAPEQPYPAALHDVDAVVAAAGQVYDGVQVLAGASAGAGIAAGVALYRRDREQPLPVGMLLICPALDDQSTFDDDAALTRDDMRGFWAEYLAGRTPTAYAAPARAANLERLPETAVIVTSCDPLRPEGVAFAASLAEAGVECTLRALSGGYHGFEYEAPHASFTVGATAEWAEIIRRMVAS